MESRAMWSDQGRQGCARQHACHSIYSRLGHAEGPSVLLKVLLAFGIPTLVFIAVLVMAGTLFGGIFNAEAGPVLLSLAVALASTALVVTGIWWFTQRPARSGNSAEQTET